MTDSKEAVYDAEIAPLMSQIIAICTRAGIPIHAAFQLDEDLACIIHRAPPRAEVPEDDRDGFDTWAKRYDPAARDAGWPGPVMTLTTRGPDGRVKSIEAIL